MINQLSATGEPFSIRHIMKGIYVSIDESKTFYADWTDDGRGQTAFPLYYPCCVAPLAAGQFDIPANYTGKYIHVKAYTKWMLNFDSAFLYNKDIRILSKTTSSSTLKNTIIPTYNFFPEGGDAIEGASNKIAFKANDQWGRPVKIKGIIQDNHGCKS